MLGSLSVLTDLGVAGLLPAPLRQVSGVAGALLAAECARCRVGLMAGLKVQPWSASSSISFLVASYLRYCE